jgi:hypothetical protein
MPLEFQKTIIGNANYNASEPKRPFWPTFFYVRRVGRGRSGALACTVVRPPTRYPFPPPPAASAFRS